MNYLKYISRKTIFLLLACLVGTMAVSCQDDQLYNSQTDGIEGAPALLSLSVNLNEMKGVSRAAMTDANVNKINNLWVGIYNVATGKRTYNKLFSEPELKTSANTHAGVELPQIETKSGRSYIVAVANVNNNYGITDNEELQTAVGFETNHGGALSALLSKADTWEKYKSISFMLTDPSSIDFSASSNLAMSGSYYESGGNSISDPASWYDEKGDPASVYIPASKESAMKLPGYIHLRRMISYVKFNIAAAEYVTVEPVSWQVHNTPIITYLQERERNAADVSTYFGEREGYSSNHGTSNLSYDFTPVGNLTDAIGGATTIDGVTTGRSFDFYQFENKQKAVEYKILLEDDYIGVNPEAVSPYADREREWKNDLQEIDPDGDHYQENTSLYKSLSGGKVSPVPGKLETTGNFASYVTFRLKVTYWVIQSTNEATPGRETPVAPETESAVRREGYANYTVHLGYIEGNDNVEKATDFNCRRNMKYTYNVKVNSLNNIIVEAFKNGENQPGAEGDVTDVQNTGRIELDAHYATFNIQLSNKERKDLKWMIEAPYNDRAYSYYSDDYRPGGIHADNAETLAKDQFYNWIRFKPTTKADVLRRYRDSEDELEKNIWTLEQLADPENNLGIDADGKQVSYDENDETQLWYTVFIDEYVYHKGVEGVESDGPDGDRGIVEKGWHAYVNQAPRIAWIACNNRHLSTDRESLYLNSKYMISQNSILTYYSADNRTPNNTALGIERENETFGLNLAWSQNAWNSLNDPNENNGRYNVWDYLTGGSIESQTTNVSWNTVAQTTDISINGESIPCYTLFKRDAINTDQLKETVGKTAPIFMPQAITTDIYNSRTSYNPFPDGSLYEVITACMSRNRDENGNGVIDVDEVKWYVPTTGKYARIILGRAAIPQAQRLMNFDETPVYGFRHGDSYNTTSSDYNSRFHYASSDRKVVWVEEGTSTSDWLQGNWDMGAWQIRCVRNLGVNMERVIENDPVIPAYTYDNFIFALEYYENACKRAPRSEALPAHDVQSSTNQPAYKFEVATSDCNSGNTVIVGETSLTLNVAGVLSNYTTDLWKTACTGNYICGGYSQNGDNSGWRVPNQKELVMMRRQGLLAAGTNNADIWMSCTQEHYDSSKNRNADGLPNTRRFFGFYPNRGTIFTTPGSPGSSPQRYHVRCVRDIMNN